MLRSDLVDYLARKERCKDLVREAEHEQLIHAVQIQGSHWDGHRKVVSWIGSRMVKLSSKLHR